MLRRGKAPGKLAKQLIRRVGDADVALAGAETRPKVLKTLEDAEIQEIRAATRADARALEELIAELRTEIDARAERRERMTELMRYKVEQARLWRSVGVQERIPQMHMSKGARLAVLFLIAAVDFNVFAQAYATVIDADEYGIGWATGGVIGLAVFFCGYTLAHAVKGSILSRAQRQFLSAADNNRIYVDPSIRPQLVDSKSSPLALWLTAIIFLSLMIAAIGVRLGGEAEPNPSLLFFQGLIPLVGFGVELFLHDPMERDDPLPTWRDRRLERRLAKAERRLRVVAAQVEAKVAKVEKLYRVEDAILDVEQKDMGLRHTTDLVLNGGHIPTVSTNGRVAEVDRDQLEKTIKMARSSRS
ncbi:hypothetical protein I6A84_35470 [Frankia sp. CNm7]|uniref:Uncharacterized protein n=1 Tax=Frankia nepalensis TaxID=1836974 RepID=A0A937UQC3_9ACTN|nr:hypothetical protein [Frankia nepalensis]MBL7494802.1 hypothetical protein [Frankia nepalensis]MBL7514099.1 hypothetical protein [Frankia nepalensis]MBL7523242.1 hypothetical protein [Frankia nepalensis]MBL7626521.1 hypothetical protein [Frankia nepalensis]